MNWRTLTVGLVLGLVLGLALGWFLFRAPAEITPPVGGEAHPREAPETKRSQSAPPTAPTLSGSRQTSAKSTATAVDVVPRLAARLDVARKGGDWRAFLSALEALGAANTPEADRALIAILGDETLSFAQGISQRFYEWLKDSEEEGILDAAKARLPLSRLAQQDESGWLLLIGVHGTMNDLRWAREDLSSGDEQLVVCGMAESRNGEVRAVVRRELEGPVDLLPAMSAYGYWAAAAEALVDAHPEEGVPILKNAIERVWTDAPGTRIALHCTLPLLVKAHGPDRLEEVRDYIASLDIPDEFVSSFLQTAYVLDYRGVDIGALRHVVTWPTATLRRIVGQGGPKSAEEEAMLARAIDSIRRYPLLHTEQNLDLLEEAVQWMGAIVREEIHERLPALRQTLPWRPR